MTRYKNINELDARIERIISRTVKAYYTDWKNYDRPKYMVCKGSHKKEDKDLVLIVRAYGTYLVKINDIKNNNAWATTLYEYYQTQERATYYRVNIDRLTIEKIDPTTYKIA